MPYLVASTAAERHTFVVQVLAAREVPLMKGNFLLQSLPGVKVNQDSNHFHNTRFLKRLVVFKISPQSITYSLENRRGPELHREVRQINPNQTSTHLFSLRVKQGVPSFEQDWSELNVPEAGEDPVRILFSVEPEGKIAAGQYSDNGKFFE